MFSSGDSARLLVFLLETAIATSDVEHDEYSKNREQNDCGGVHHFSFE
jgi:hypothetical protein